MKRFIRLLDSLGVEKLSDRASHVKIIAKKATRTAIGLTGSKMAILLRCHFVNRCSELAPRKVHKSESIIIEIIIIMIAGGAAARREFERRDRASRECPNNSEANCCHTTEKRPPPPQVEGSTAPDPLHRIGYACDASAASCLSCLALRFSLRV